MIFKYPEFPQRQERRETVSVILRLVRDRSIGVWDGTSKEEHTDPKTGQVTERERWEFLPRFYIEVEGVPDMKDTQALETLKGRAINVTAGERILAEKGLI